MAAIGLHRQPHLGFGLRADHGPIACTRGLIGVDCVERTLELRRGAAMTAPHRTHMQRDCLMRGVCERVGVALSRERVQESFVSTGLAPALGAR